MNKPEHGCHGLSILESRLRDRVQRAACAGYLQGRSLRSTPAEGGEGRRTGTREKPSCHAGPTTASADHTESSRSKMAIQSCPELGEESQVFIPCCQLVIEYGSPWKGMSPWMSQLSATEAVPKEG